MRLARTIGVLILIAVLSFTATSIALRSGSPTVSSVIESAATGETTDSVVLARQGIVEGRQLVVFVFGGSRCAACSSPEVSSAVRRIRSLLQTNHMNDFSSTSVIGVAINTDIETGLKYLRTAGLESYDAISVGLGWRNEDVARLLWADTLRAVAVPRVVAVARQLSAKTDPVELRFGRDSVLMVLTGTDALLSWVNAGAPIATR